MGWALTLPTQTSLWFCDSAHASNIHRSPSSLINATKSLDTGQRALLCPRELQAALTRGSQRAKTSLLLQETPKELSSSHTPNNFYSLQTPHFSWLKGLLVVLPLESPAPPTTNRMLKVTTFSKASSPADLMIVHISPSPAEHFPISI